VVNVSEIQQGSSFALILLEASQPQRQALAKAGRQARDRSHAQDA
jgi:hypothetical protein